MHGVQSDPEGALWRDPPHYWEQIVWPAYLRAHRDVFVNGDVETGRSSGKIGGLVVVEGMNTTMGEMVDVVCEKLKRELIQSV
jgi:nicotinamide/nicotinate riboside kinase